MSQTRIKKRLLRKAIGVRALNDPAAKRIQRNLKAGGGDAATEVYTLRTVDTGELIYFDVYSMKQFCKANLRPVAVPIDWGRVERLATNGAVDPARIRDHTIKTALEPIIICRDGAGRGEDQIVDGSHRYVAFALGLKMANMLDIPIPAYVLAQDQWRDFLIPSRVAEAFGFGTSGL